MSDSEIVTAIPIDLKSIWIHDLDDPPGTIKHYPYSSFDDRDESLDIEVIGEHYAGRVYPVYDISSFENVAMKVSVDIVRADPYNPTSGTLADLKAFARSRKSVMVRDGAGRSVTGPIQGLSESGKHFGFTASFTVEHADVEMVIV
jgi:hypothetical protein